MRHRRQQVGQLLLSLQYELTLRQGLPMIRSRTGTPTLKTFLTLLLRMARIYLYFCPGFDRRTLALSQVSKGFS